MPGRVIITELSFNVTRSPEVLRQLLGSVEVVDVDE